MYNFENKTDDDNYDYNSLYSRDSSIYSLKHSFRCDSSLYSTISEFSESFEQDESYNVNDIIDSYLHNEDLIEIVDNLFDIKPLEYENDNEIFINEKNEKHFTLPLTPDQYYMLKDVWNQQMDNEITKHNRVRYINNISELGHLSLANSDISTGSCPELYTSDISSSSLKSRFYDDNDENNDKNKNYKKETKKGWRNWFKKSDKIKTNFYDNLIKKSKI
jgi:hypothetical protein